MLIISQDFNWHDRGEGGTYVFGEDGYLTIDGSRGRALCSRPITNPIRAPQDAIELRLRVVLGKSYHIRFYDSEEQLAVDCQIDGDGRVRFARQGSYVDSGRSLTIHYGDPYSDPTNRPPYVVPSDEHCFRFEGFEFGRGKGRFVLDKQEPVTLDGCVSPNSRELSKVELVTQDVEPGSLIRLREYAEYIAGAPVYREDFPLHWKPVPPPPDGWPDDNVSETLMRPVDYRWLETATLYGYVKTHISCLAKGALEFEMKANFEMKTPDTGVESTLVLEEYQGIIKYTNIQLGLLRDRMSIHTAGGEEIEFENIEVANNRVYRFRVEWDTYAQEVRVWIDDTAMTHDGSSVLTFGNLPEKGIDTITIHPGMVDPKVSGDPRAKLSLMQKQQGLKAREASPLLTYWGNFRVYDLSKPY